MMRSMSTMYGRAGWSVLLVTFTGPTAAWAQDGGTVAAQPGASAQLAAPAASSDTVGDIIVTAEKRSTSINKVGLTIAAFDSATLQKQGVASVKDIAKLVPGLTYTESASSTPVYTLRGVGFYETSLAGYPDVSVYVDQVPLQFPVLTTQAGLDLERVEVIKGPQGILFGQNSTGGAINYVAAKPTEAFHAGASVSVGRFNRIEGTGYLSGKIAEDLTARLSFKVENGDPWQYSYTRNDKLGKIRNYVGRLLLDWAPSDRMTFTLNVNGWVNKSDPQAGQYFNFRPQIVQSRNLPILAAIPFAPENNRAADWAFRLRGDENMYQLSLRTDYEISDDVTTTSITSYASYNKDDVDTNSGLSIANEEVAGHRGFIRTFTQELRVANASANRLRWTVGGNYEKSHVYEFVEFRYPFATLADTFGVNANNYYSNQHMENYAAFGNIDFDVLPNLTIKGGARYTENRHKYLECNNDIGTGEYAAFFSNLSSLLSGKKVTIPPGGCALLDQFTFLPGPDNDHLNEHSLSWRAGLDYRVHPGTLLYVNISKGYKAGGFSTLGASTTKQLAPVVQESLLDYEAGFKIQLFDKRVQLNGAAFYYDYANKQVRTKLIDPIFGVIDTLANVPKSSVKGAELSIAARPAAGLDLTASATYLDAKVKQYIGVNGIGTVANFAGTPLPFSSKWQTAATVDYQWDLSGGYKASVGGTLTYHSSTFSVVGGGDVARVDPYALLDLRASVTFPDQRLQFSIWGRNVTDKYYWTNVVNVYDTSVRYTGQPVTYGATVSFKY
jgi:iron complex outermembrane receptor protein